MFCTLSDYRADFRNIIYIVCDSFPYCPNAKNAHLPTCPIAKLFGYQIFPLSNYPFTKLNIGHIVDLPNCPFYQIVSLPNCLLIKRQFFESIIIIIIIIKNIFIQGSTIRLQFCFSM